MSQALEKRIDKKALRWAKRTGVDLSGYRTDEMLRVFEDLFSVVALAPIMVRSIALTWLVSLPLVGLAFYSSVGTWSMVALVIYTLVVGWFLGGLLGVIKIARRVLQNLTQILEMALETVQTISDDLSNLARGSGDSKRATPSLVGLFEGVMHVVIVPAIKVVIAAKTGIFRRPVIWVLERTLLRAGHAVSRMLARGLSRRAKAGDVVGEERQLTDGQDGGADSDGLFDATSLVGLKNTTDGFLTTARSRVGKISGRVTRIALFPLQLALIGASTAAIVPLLIAYWLLVL